MADVTINPAPTPSEQLVAEAKREATITDARGRSIKLVRPGPLAQFRLVKLVGGDTAMNQVYMGMVMPLVFVQYIDGDIVPMPQTERELEALIERLGEDGIEAVMKGVVENFDQADAAKVRDEVKN